MWPMYVDYTDDECKKVLRSLELEAYASVINAFRAQGSLSKERKKMLQDLCSILSISLERHRAEIRRAVNDEHLNTIAERLSGPNTSTEWAIEGRRLVPLMPRLVPQTVFTAIANSVATAQAAKNATLPMPGKTGLRENGENDIIETMMGRKRKEPPTDMSATNSKYVAIENLLANSFDSTNDLHTDAMQTLNESSISDCSTTSVSSTSQIAPILSETSPVTTVSFITTCTSPIKAPVKHATGKSASTVTTFSSFDQLSSNISSSKTISSACVPAVGHEEQVSTSDSNSKFLTDIQDITRLSQSSCTLKPLATSGATQNSSLPIERFPVATSSASSRSKFLPQVVKPKASTHIKPPIPTSLGIKINTQPPVGHRSVSPKCTSFRAKPETAPTIMKKPISTLNPPQSSSESASAASTSLLSNESLPMLKSSLPVTTKSHVTKSECSSTSNQSILQQPTTKVTPMPKPFQKPGTPNSQFVARTLFSSGAKAGAKSLPPVIFNVSTSSCSPIQSAAKTSLPGQSSEAAKAPTPQLLPKAPTGLAPNQFKLSTSNAPTIQYRNEGGMVRSARIVNISQPVGSRLPCAISPSAISALGLSSGLTSTALRVTLPAGTLHTSSALRVSAAAKPNVIVVHKAQMWPRTQGAAVIMSSTGSIPKLSNDVKQDKSRQCINKVIPRPIAPATSHSTASSNASVKASEVNSLAALSTKGLPSENVQPDSTSTKASESADAKCKRNLLADVIEASGIMKAGTPEKFLKKDFENKDSHRLKPVSEIKNNKNSEEIITIPSEAVTSTAIAQGLDKLEIIRAESPSVSLPTSQGSEREKKAPDTNQGSSTHLDAIQVQTKKACDIFTSRTQETVHKSSPSCEAKPKLTTEAK